ncbi:hypothetical protein EGW08_000269, partial [Elysia chlorotica]
RPPLALSLLLSVALCTLPGTRSTDLLYTSKEEVKVGTTLGLLGRDSNLSRILSQQDLHSLDFALVSGDESGALSLDLETGALSTATRLDREALCPNRWPCTLALSASASTQSGQQFFEFKVKVTVQDINDNSPSFASRSVAVALDEDAARFFSFSIPRAVDRDVGLYGLQSYALATPSDQFGLKVSRNLDGSLNPQLYVKTGLDRETRDAYQLTVLALDGGAPPRSGTLLVNVTLNDVNDNVPQFLQTRYTVNVTETTASQTRVLRLEAQDADSGLNGQVTYRLGARQTNLPPDLFQVLPDSGHVITLQKLADFQGRKFQLIVEAVDGGSEPLSAQAEVVIHVVDSVNDPPRLKFTRPAWSKVSSVREDALRGVVVGAFSVSDSDTGRNGEIRCFLDESSRQGTLAAQTFGLHKISSESYKLTVYNPLDRETTDSYQVSITCRDAGSPPLAVRDTLSVEVEDVNDFAPRFSQPVRRASLAENSPNNFVLRLEAADRDLGDNGRVRYSLGTVSSLVATFIRVDALTGELTTRKPLDRELTDRLDFPVVASDMGDPAMSSTARVLITVLDQNDNFPRVPLGYSLALAENRRPGALVGQIEAIDPDLGAAGEIRYQLMSGRLFNLTERGLLTALRTFDREHRDLYDISVLASDLAPSNPRTNLLHIRVRIEDDNDHVPEFRFPRAGNATTVTTTDAPVNATLGYLQARDADLGENGTLRYTVLDDAGLDILRVDHVTGRIYTSRNLRARDEGEHMVTLFVRDLGIRPLTSTGSLRLVVVAGNSSLAGSGQSGRLTGAELTVLVSGLVLLVLLLTLCALLALLRTFRRDVRDRRLKYGDGSHSPGPDKTGACQEVDSQSADPDGKWRQYKKIPGPGGVSYDVEDDVIMFKLKLAEQYRELEPDDKEACVQTVSRRSSGPSDAADGLPGLALSQTAQTSRAMATFYCGESAVTEHGKTDRDARYEKPNNIPENLMEMFKVCEYDTYIPEHLMEMFQVCEYDTYIPENLMEMFQVCEYDTYIPENLMEMFQVCENDTYIPENLMEMFKVCEYDTYIPENLMEMFKVGKDGNLELQSVSSRDTSAADSGHGTSEDGTAIFTSTFVTLSLGRLRHLSVSSNAAFSLRKDDKEPPSDATCSKRSAISGFEEPPILKTFRPGGPTKGHVSREGATLSLRKVRSEVSQAASRPGSPLPAKPGQKGASTGLDDTLLKRLVISGRRLTTEDDGYCSSAPDADSVREPGHKDPREQLLYPPPPSLTSSFRDTRLCSEPPVSPYTKMSSLPPFTYQDKSSIPRALASPYPSSSNSGPNAVTLEASGRGSSPVAQSGWQKLTGSPGDRTGPLWRAPRSANTTTSSSTPSPYTDIHMETGPNRELLNDSLESREGSHTTTTSGSYAFDDEELFVDLASADC